MTIGVPGNVPYVITVGAMTDSFTREDPNDDILATFSSAGPTAEGFVKPDIVAPGDTTCWASLEEGQPVSERPSQSSDRRRRVLRDCPPTSTGSRVSLSGAAAILLQSDPSLTPDQVKCPY